MDAGNDVLVVGVGALGSALVRGDVRVSDVNRLLGTTLPSADAETVELLVRRLWAQPPSD